MGYSKLTYEDYMLSDWVDFNNPTNDRVVTPPMWAKELHEQGFKGVSAIDFYNHIFKNNLEPHRKPKDYRTGEYRGIATEIKQAKDSEGNPTKKVRRVFVYQDQKSLYDLIDNSEDFCLMPMVGYAGRKSTDQNARLLYAMVIEIDDIQPKDGIKELIYFWSRPDFSNPMPQPTYIVCSGTGLHLYYVFDKPIPEYPYIKKQLAKAKTYLTRLWWDKPITKDWEEDKVQYEALNQPFRLVGTRAKKTGVYAMAFKTGPDITIDYLNSRIPDEKCRVNLERTESIALQEAKEKYPLWYQARVVEGKPQKLWQRHKGIYYNWIDKVHHGAEVGHRYFCLENLCSLGVQCGIPREEVLKDATEMAEFLETKTNSDDNHFTKFDLDSAMSTYDKGSTSAYTRTIATISKKTGIALQPNRRNGLKQAEHLEIARAIRDVKVRQKGKKDWREGNGRKSSQEIVQAWRKEHPEGTPKDCIKETGLDKNTVYKWWGSNLANRKPSKEIVQAWRKEHPEGTPKDCIKETKLNKNTVYKWWKDNESK